MDNKDFKKFWLKSKTVIINLLTAVFSTLVLFWEDIGNLLNDNLPYLKSILTPNRMLVAFIILALFNTYSRIKKNDPLAMKKKDCKKCDKEEDKDNGQSE